MPSESTESALALGSVVVGRYRIEKLLGTGGMGVVAAAYDLQLRRRVAIKSLAPDALQYRDVVERFIREGRSIATIRGEHVARVIDIGVLDHGAPFMVLEYLEGVDLGKYLSIHGPLPVADVVRYVLEACEVLAEAHAAKIVHRDLKPANLFLTEGPDHRKIIKVLDFGVSKLLDEPMTATSQMLGTVMYMSPEQLETSNRVDARSDIWALGVIMYELLAGVPPFSGSTMFCIAQSILANAPPSLRSVRPDVSAELESVIRSCLRTNPAERPRSVLELARALAPFARKRDRESVGAISCIFSGEPPSSGDPSCTDAPAIEDRPRSIEPPVPTAPTQPAPPPGASVSSLSPMIAALGIADIPSDISEPLLARGAKLGDLARSLGTMIPSGAASSGATAKIAAEDAPPAAPPGLSTPSTPALSTNAPAPRVAVRREWASRSSVALFAAAIATLLLLVAAVRSASPAPATVATVSKSDDVALVITSTNDGAHVRIDDGPLVPLPFETRVPQDAREHTLLFEAPGCTPRAKTIHFSSERMVVDVYLSPK